MDQDLRYSANSDPWIAVRRSIFYFYGSDRFQIDRDHDPAQQRTQFWDFINPHDFGSFSK